MSDLDNPTPPGDRPLECSECKKPINVFYTDVSTKSISHTHMCADCPQLEKKLRGPAPSEEPGDPGSRASSLCCGNCGTTLETVRMGALLGCGTCYDIFEDVLIDELKSQKKMPSKVIQKRRSSALHMGRTPGQAAVMSTSMRLLALNEALSETLSREDYEQAAWLRDQIKELTEGEDSEAG